MVNISNAECKWLRMFSVPIDVNVSQLCCQVFQLPLCSVFLLNWTHCASGNKLENRVITYNIRIVSSGLIKSCVFVCVCVLFRDTSDPIYALGVRLFWEHAPLITLVIVRQEREARNVRLRESFSALESWKCRQTLVMTVVCYCKVWGLVSV